MLSQDKKGISIIVGYVLLVSFAIILGVIVYQWIKTYVPTDALECSDGVSIFLQTYSYDCVANTLTIEIKNNGRFNVAGYFIRATDDADEELATIDLSDYTSEGKGGVVLFSTLNSFEPNDEPITNIFDLSSSGISQVYSIEIVPVRFEKQNGKNRFTSCVNSKIKEEIQCD